MEKRLFKNTTNKVISGVCSGIAEYFAVDPTLVRLGVVALCVFSAGSACIAYIVAAVIMPEKPTDYFDE